MATKMLSEKLGEVEYDNLIVGLTPAQARRCWQDRQHRQ